VCAVDLGEELVRHRPVFADGAVESAVSLLGHEWRWRDALDGPGKIGEGRSALQGDDGRGLRGLVQVGGELRMGCGDTWGRHVLGLSIGHRERRGASALIGWGLRMLLLGDRVCAV
jgi:hypothetical protein